MAQGQSSSPGQPGAFWAADLAQVLRDTGAGARGLSDQEARQRLARDGPNQIDQVHRRRGLRLLLKQFTSPIILILSGATVLSILVGDLTDGVIILLIIAASGLLGFWQERAAGRAVDALQARVQVRTEVCRDGREVAVPTSEIVVGDLVLLRPGDVVPADCRVIESHDMQVDQAALTGEPFPVEKKPEPVPADTPLADRASTLFMGTHLVSGDGTAVVVRTGGSTELAGVSSRISGRKARTGFQRALTGYGLLLAAVMVVLLGAIFVVNLLLGRPLVQSLLFSLALAVGLTPQMLPAIVSVSLSVGARRMAEHKVIVKRLEVIEDFGAMTVLLTDKTGTITAGVVRLDAALDVDGEESDEIRRLARLNAGLQQGYGNPLDQAIMAGAPPVDATLRRGEVPYDFKRKRLSMLVDEKGTPTLITKGALSSVLAACTTARTSDGVVPLDRVRDALQHRFEELSSNGFRVLGLAIRQLAAWDSVSEADEAEMMLVGLLTFQDPPKSDAGTALRNLAELGVSTRLITGDNRFAASHVAQQVGLVGEVLVGGDIDRLSDQELTERAAKAAVFAEVEPLHKERVVAALNRTGAVVGFLGDGINDAPGLHAADVGISVDTAVDVAKQAAAIVLLEKDLNVVIEGVRLGRQTFTNTFKYVRVNTSAAFGNVVSMSVAAAFLPFLPLLPRQILLLNFLSDIPYATLPTDRIDAEQIQRPRRSTVKGIRNFMLVFGTISVLFDLGTYLVLRMVFNANAAVFRTGWFIEFTVTEIAVLMVLRTNRPFFRSRPARPLLITSSALAAVTVAVPYTPLAGPLGLAPLNGAILAALAVLTIAYVLVNEAVKRLFPPDRQ
ncbi:MAG TPA: magnesium-translocating P-type ATPase [Micromonospora sp.]|nr:magnesium-translocating P-type ATPase [Micromonospora sp.]